ncbi:hypothetical protein FBU30_002940 [Linnemannia zychae]|nr:hypothetical protein FBU30_002940 [Linnemannia zychae]
MEGLNNSNTATANTTSSTPASNNTMLAFNLPLESFASVPMSTQQAMDSGILAICMIFDSSRGVSGVPDIAFNDCATMLTGLSGSRASEQSRQVGISKETASFVREIKPYPKNLPPTMFKDAAHPSLTYNGDTVSSGTTITGGLIEDEYDIRAQVDATLTITSNDAKMNTWFGFKSDGALYLRGNGWDDMDIRESVLAALHLAEEQLECTVVYLCLEKSNPHLSKLVRALMYASFEVVHPGVLAQADSKYLVLGMEL